MTLFDVTNYGGPEKPKRSSNRTAPAEVKLRPPWVLVSTHRGGPMAHLLNPKSTVPNKYGAWLTRCDRTGYRVVVEGFPMARCCATCWRIYEADE